MYFNSQKKRDSWKRDGAVFSFEKETEKSTMAEPEGPKEQEVLTKDDIPEIVRTVAAGPNQVSHRGYVTGTRRLSLGENGVANNQPAELASLRRLPRHCRKRC